MKLFHSPYSPFVRKVRVVAHELGLSSDIELVPAGVWPTRPDNTIVPFNPLSQVPTLLLDDGTTLADSRVICEYLNSLAQGQIFPPEGRDRWDALFMQSTADGLINAALLARYENYARPEILQWDQWYAGQIGKIMRSLEFLQSKVLAHKDLHIGHFSVACATEYLDLRFAELEWQKAYQELAAWSLQIQTRESLVISRPPTGTIN